MEQSVCRISPQTNEELPPQLTGHTDAQCSWFRLPSGLWSYDHLHQSAKQRDTKQPLQQFLRKPIFQSTNLSLQVHIFCLLGEGGWGRFPQNQKRWPLLLLSNSAQSTCIRYRKAYTPCPIASLTELATHLTQALHVGGAAHTESEPNPVERTWARDDAWSTEIRSLVTSSLVWSLRPSDNSIWTQGLVSQLWEGRGQVYPTALLL